MHVLRLHHVPRAGQLSSLQVSKMQGLAAWLCSILYLAFNMGFHYLTFMGRNLKSRKKLMLVRTINIGNMNSKNILNSVSIFNESVVVTSNYRQIILG